MLPQFLTTKSSDGILKSNRRFQNTTRAPLRQRRRKTAKNAYFSFPTGRVVLFVVVVQWTGLWFHYGGNANDWILAFLKGPRVAPREPSPGQPPRRRPEDPRPANTPEIFTARTKQQNKAVQTAHDAFLELKTNQRLQPCRLDGNCTTPPTTKSALSFLFGGSSAASSSSSKIVLHNPLSLTRYYCGKEILGNGGIMELEERDLATCQSESSSSQRPYLFAPQTPTISGHYYDSKLNKKRKLQNPTELYWNFAGEGAGYGYGYEMSPDEERQVYETEEFKCPIACRKNGGFELLSVINVKDTPWEIMSTMEGELYYSQARYRPKAHRNDQYYATTSFQSEIPLPYFSWAEYQIQHTPPVDFDDPTIIKGASFLANNCDSQSHREEWVQGLIDTAQFRVDSLSGCLHNAELPRPNIDSDNKTAIQELYLFHLAFENQISDDYITEKLWGALASGTVPVYLGAPNIQDHVPPNSIIFVQDFETPLDLANHLIRVSKDKELYNSYHAWRYTTPLDPTFSKKYAFTKIHSTCRICKWAYAKRHGLEWNHTQQEIQEPNIARKTCRNKKRGLIGHPFKEYWLVSNSNEIEKSTGVSNVLVQSNHNDTKTCTLKDSNRVLYIDGGKLQRKVYDQDGVTDLVISQGQGNGLDQKNTDLENYILKLETPLATGAFFGIVGGITTSDDGGREWWLQDGTSRMTILTNQPVDVTVQLGTVHIPVPILTTGAIFRVRVIVENLDTDHKGARKQANYFGDIMKQDFFHPLEAYKKVE